MWESMPENVKACYQWRDGFLYVGKNRITDYYVRVLGILINPTNGKRFLKIQYVVGINETTYEEIIEEESLGKIDKQTSIRYRFCDFKSTAKNEIFNLEKMQLQNIEEEGYYIESIGWHKIDECWTYCAGNDVYTISPHNIVISPEIKKDFQIRYDETQNNIDTLETVKSLISFESVPINMCLLYLISGLLRSFFCSVNVPPQFLLNICGGTGQYKTTIAKYFFDIYSQGNGTSFACADLTSSKAALWSKIQKFRDCVFILDDLSPGVNAQETNRKNSSINDFIRVGANNEERHTMTGKRLQGEVANCSLAITAEYIFQTESIVNRTLTVNVDKYPLEEDLLKFISKNPLLIHNFARIFLTWCAINSKEVCDNIEFDWRMYRDSGAKDKYNPRVKDSIEILTICAKLLYRVFMVFEIDTIGILDIFQSNLLAIKNDEHMILQILHESKEKHNIAEEIVKLLNSKEIDLKASVFYANAFIEGSYLYIKPDYLFEHLSNSFITEKLTKNMIVKYLTKYGILEKDKSDAPTVKKGGVRYYKINLDALEDEAGVFIDIPD